MIHIPSLDCIDGNLSAAASWRGGIPLAVANPATASGLAALAAALAAARRTSVLVVYVRADVQTFGGRNAAAPAPPSPPDPSPWPAVTVALDTLAQRAVPAAWLVCNAADVGRAIRRIASAVGARLILLGWRGKPRPDGAYLNATLRDVLRDPATDVAVVGGRSPERFSQVLVP